MHSETKVQETPRMYISRLGKKTYYQFDSGYSIEEARQFSRTLPQEDIEDQFYDGDNEVFVIIENRKGGLYE